MKNWLKKHGINYKTSGKNVTKGWINIKCPFCYDHSNHLGISNTGGFHCWSCGKKGNITEIVRMLEKCSWGEAKKISQQLFQNIDFKPKKEKKEIKWPDNMIDDPLPIHKKYLKSRGFNAYELIRKYNIKFTGNIGKDRFSIVAPTGDSYILADCQRKKRKYTIGPNAENHLYGIENCKKNKAIIVEGIVDCWNIGSDCVAAIGNKLTHSQKIALLCFDFVLILFDSDAEEKAINLSYQMEGIVDNEIFIVGSKKGEKRDPANLSRSEIDEFKKLLL